MQPTPAEFNRLIDLFNAGRLEVLEARARDLVAAFPESGMAWKILGVALQAQAKDALEALQQAADRLPDDAQAHFNLGKARRDCGQALAAEACYRRALAIAPGYAAAHSNLGNVLCDLGRFADAVASYGHALTLQPGDVLTHNSLGNAQKALGRTDAALAAYRAALAWRPDYAEAHYNLGNLLRELGQAEAALECYRQALAIRPDFADAQTNLGSVLKGLGQAEAALLCFRRALQLRPADAAAHNNVGNALGDLGRLPEAIASYRVALGLDPRYLEAHSNLLFVLNYLSGQFVDSHRQEAAAFGEQAARLAGGQGGWENPPDAERRLRIGLVSGDLCNHPVGYFLEGVLAALAQNAADRLELYAYASSARSDELSARLRGNFRQWFSAFGVADEKLAQQIRADRIDILLDLSGHTAHNRLPLFAWKPAPLQATWLGYFATTGVAAIDYLIADPWTVAAEHETQFTEAIWRLPETRLCFTPPAHAVAVSALPAGEARDADGKGAGGLTFGCFNKLNKLNDRVIALWARVLHAVPGSRLFLKSAQLGDAAVQAGLRQRFAGHGIGAERLLLEGAESRERYLAAYRRVDIGLDPFPFPGGTTTVEALWMGVPVLTLAGENFLSRQGVGLLMNAGLADWVASDEDDYLARAVRLAGDLPQLARLRAGLRQQVLASPLFDTPRFAGHLEAALRSMWRRWCASPTTSAGYSGPPGTG